eukprot:m.18312 g.18312  ORF g.18312 m.18312 type:complete len:165 (+) comp30019_c0_seq2:53-547(+)
MGSLGPRAAAFPHLFSATRIGGRAVKNRFALSPLTRSRTPSSVPNDLMRDYYASFGEVGLLISEGVHVSAQARGQLHCPGLWSTDQTLAWKPITSAAHANGCVIFAQLWHQGRTCHSSMLGARHSLPHSTPLACRFDLSLSRPLCPQVVACPLLQALFLSLALA